VIDPIPAFLSDKVKTGDDASVRLALTPLSKMADRLGVAIILVRHLNKSELQKALYRGGGSIAFIGLARSGLLVAKAPDGDGVILASTKSNLARTPESLRYHIRSTASEVAILDWVGATTENADELLAIVDEMNERTKTQSAAALLRGWLSAGPMPSSQLEELSLKEGIAKKTYQRAREKAGIECCQTRDGWISFLPTQMARESDGHLATDADGVTGLA